MREVADEEDEEVRGTGRVDDCTEFDVMALVIESEAVGWRGMAVAVGDGDAAGVCTGRQMVEAGDEELSPFDFEFVFDIATDTDTNGLSTGAQWRRGGTGLSLRIALEMLEFDCVSPAAASAAARPMSPLTAAPSSGSASSPAPAPGGPRCWCEELSGATRSTCSEAPAPVDDR